MAGDRLHGRDGDGGGVIVVGSANQDYLVRLSRPPRPGETVLATGLLKQPGGKGANQAVAVARLDGSAQFIGCVGDDADGASLLRALQSDGVDTTHVQISRSPTGLALITISESGENAITVIPGSNFELSAAHVTDSVATLSEEAAVLVVQAEVRPEIIHAALRSAQSFRLRPVLNLAPYQILSAEDLLLADPLVLNESEASMMLGRRVTDVQSARAAVEDLRRLARSVIVTMGAQGADWADQTAAGHVPAHPVEHVIDTTGAGDAFVGAVATILANGGSLEQAVRLGVHAGAFAVTGVGAQSSYPLLSDLTEVAPLQPVEALEFRNTLELRNRKEDHDADTLA